MRALVYQDVQRVEVVDVPDPRIEHWDGDTYELTGGLTLNASTGSWILNGGMVDGGTIHESGGAVLAFTNAGTFKNGFRLHQQSSASAEASCVCDRYGKRRSRGTRHRRL